MRRERDNAGIDSPATPRQRGKACERCWKRKQKLCEHIEEKRESLQKQLRHKRPRQADASNAEQLETAPVQSSEKAGHEKEQETTEHTVEAAMGEIGFLSRSAMAEPRNERDEDPQELATGRMLRAALAITGANPIESRIDALQQVVGGMADQSFSLKRPLVTPFVSRFLDTEGIRFLHINSTHLWEDVEEFFFGTWILA
ncbi:hypothetical protein N7450_008161 [Penicillium hetheringtonii]|uniref:Uncharacterized protein n=1 Tax=Penicillium hetheringtonii TaxID=911720 RepID=A0AAD6DFU1_9EURO|nr:hypothetical protein N7450_008161 [Penicillium hetheringtonii]